MPIHHAARSGPCQVNAEAVQHSSRGIGLELVRQLVSDPSNVVVAMCRDPARASKLSALKAAAPGQLYVVALDVGSEASIRGSVAEVEGILGSKGLDYLYNNAAITDGGRRLGVRFLVRRIVGHAPANVAGPALMGTVYLPLLEKGRRKVIVNMTSGLASIGLDFGAKNAMYSISKTALNMLVRIQAGKDAADLIAYVVDPGSRQVEESVERLIRLATTATAESSGRFLRHDGEQVPW
ncbi:C-factor [Rhodofomes roseus]|uniref:C-factor n=1 Tax=Rhodofomes roseus TaxID=34475 RepID=A0ABQ8K520_9APHY|nr:C-factor [Rhodofomes roseus]KAH9831801.1 C-factor [Rhodofomes roseus]